MDPVTQAALIVVMGQDAVTPPGGGPVAAPIEAFPSYTYTGSSPRTIILHWESGDASAYTVLYYGAVDYSNRIVELTPGITSYTTNYIEFAKHTFNIVHRKNAVWSAALTLEYEERDE